MSTTHRRPQHVPKRPVNDDDDVPSVGGISSITQSANASVDGSSDGDLAIRPMRGGAISPATSRGATRVVIGPSRSENILAMLARYPRISILNFPEILRVCNIKCDASAVDDLWLTVVGTSGATYADPQQVCRVIVDNGGAYVGDSKPFSVVMTPGLSATLLAPTAASTAKGRAASPPVGAPIRSRSKTRQGSPPMYFGIPASALFHPNVHRPHEDHLHNLEVTRNRSLSATKRQKLSPAAIENVSLRLYTDADRLRKKYELERTRVVEERAASESAECTGKPKINSTSLQRLSLAQRGPMSYARDTQSFVWKLKGASSPSRDSLPEPEFKPNIRGRSRTPPPDRSIEIKGFYESVTRMRQSSPLRSTSPKCKFEDSLRGYSSPSRGLENRPPSTFGYERATTPRAKLVPGPSLLQEVERQTRFIETTLRSKEPLVVDRFDNETTPLFDNDSISYHPSTQSSRRLLDEKVKAGEITPRDASAVREALQHVTTASLVSRFEYDRTQARTQGSYDMVFRARQRSQSPRKSFESSTQSVILSRGSRVS